LASAARRTSAIASLRRPRLPGLSALSCPAGPGAGGKGERAPPPPPGANVVRRDLEDRHGSGTLAEVAAILRRSIERGLDRLDENIEAAHAFGRGVTLEQTREFVRLYVSDRTLDLGPEGERGVAELLGRAAAAGLLPNAGPIDVVRPAPD